MKKRALSTILLLATAVGGAGIATVAEPAPASALPSCGKGYHSVLEVTSKTGVYKSRAGIGNPSELIKYKYPRDIVRGHVYDSHVYATMARTAAWPYPYGFMSVDKLSFVACEQD